jgi:hypothetical protein
MGKFSETIGAVVASVITLAVLAVIVANGSNSAGVITAFFNGLANLIRAAVSPSNGNVSQLTGGLFGNNGSSILPSSGFSNPFGLPSFGSPSGGSGLFGSPSDGSGGFIDNSGTSGFVDNTSSFVDSGSSAFSDFGGLVDSGTAFA